MLNNIQLKRGARAEKVVSLDKRTRCIKCSTRVIINAIAYESKIPSRAAERNPALVVNDSTILITPNADIVHTKYEMI